MASLPPFELLPPEQAFAILKQMYTQLADATRISRTANFAAFSIVFYDWMICFHEEIQYFWMKQWTIVTTFYMVTRYFNTPVLAIIALLPPTVTPTFNFCWNFLKFQTASGLVMFFFVECLLAMRLYALYSGSKVLLCFLMFGLCCTLASMSTLTGLYFANSSVITHLVPTINYKVCIPIDVPDYFTAFWVAPLTFQTVCFTLALVKGISTLRRTNTGRFGTKLVGVLMRDSFIYFIGIAIAECSVVIIWLTRPDTLMQATVGFAMASFTILSSRLLINIREAARGPEVPSTWGAPAGTTFQTYDRQSSRQSSSKDTGSYSMGSRMSSDNYQHSPWQARHAPILDSIHDKNIEITITRDPGQSRIRWED